MESDGDITCGVDTDNSGFPLDSATSTAATYDDDIWHHVSCVKDSSSTLTLFIDGVQVAQDTSLTGTGTYANDDALYFGIDGDGTSNPWAGSLDEFKLYHYPRTQEQIISDMNAGHPLGGSPIGSQAIYWKLDEQQGTTANDSVGNQNGTISNSTWATQTNCKINGCLSLDGTGDYVTIATASDAEVDFGPSEPFSGSAWVNITTMPASGDEDGIITKWDDTGNLSAYKLVVDGDSSTGHFEIHIYDESASQAITVAQADDSLATSTWYHVAWTFNGGVAGAAGDLELFVNGQSIGTNAANASFLGIEDLEADAECLALI